MFLLDDHEIVRRGLHDVFSGADDIQVVGEAGTAAGALARIPVIRPDVAILDVRLPDGSGLEVCREIRTRLADVKCLVLTSYADDEARSGAIAAGASAYVLKAVRAEELLATVRAVAAGRSLIEPEATARGPERPRDAAPQESHGKDDGADGGDDRLASLTEQERRILELIGEGLTNRLIGERLHLAEKTVKNYVSSLLAKLGMQRRSQAAAYVARIQAGRR